VYTPHPEFTGTDVITYFIEDSEGQKSRAEVWVRVNEKPALIIDDVTVPEGNGGTTTATFTVSLSSPVEVPVTFDYATGDGTAVAGQHFVAVGGTGVLKPGETSKTIEVPIIGNATYDGRASRNFSVKLSRVVNKTAAIYGGVGKGVIVEDDLKPTISILPDLSVVEGNSGTTAVTFLVRLSGETTVPAAVAYKPASGTAKLADNDFVDVSDTVTFAPGENEKTITVQVVGDTKVEKNEAFTVVLGKVTDAVIGGSGKVTVTIVDDDGAVSPNSADSVEPGSVEPGSVEPASAEISDVV
jgi:chitinase